SEVEILDAEGRPARAFLAGSAAIVRIRVFFFRVLESPTVGIVIRDRLGNEVYGTNTYYQQVETGRWSPGQTLEVRFRLALARGLVCDRRGRARGIPLDRARVHTPPLARRTPPVPRGRREPAGGRAARGGAPARPRTRARRSAPRERRGLARGGRPAAGGLSARAGSPAPRGERRLASGRHRPRPRSAAPRGAHPTRLVGRWPALRARTPGCVRAL